MYVIKRDGTSVPFDRSKIKIAVEKAMKNGSGLYHPDIAEAVARDCEKYFIDLNETPTIYKIEGYVYDRLFIITAKLLEPMRDIEQFSSLKDK